MTPRNDAGARARRSRRGSKRAPRRRWGAEQRREALARFAGSGLTQAEFCRRTGLSAATFSTWCRKAARHDREAATPVGGFAQVRVAPALAAASTHPTIVVQVDDGLRVTVPVGTDPLWLGQVLSGLRPR